MPEIYEKELVRPGWYSADGGDTLVTPERIDRWEKEFQQLRKEGYGFPTPWGHKLTAVPHDGDPYALDEAYARWNAGDMEWVEKRDNGRLYLMGTVPPGYKIDENRGALVNEQAGTIVKYVSPGFGNWTDGKGRSHEDVLFHAALCTHPVQHEQEGFRRATKLPPTIARASGVRFLSSSGRISGLTMMAIPKGLAMADEPDADDKDKKKKKPFDAPGGDAPAGDGLDAPGGEVGDSTPAPIEDAAPAIGDDGIAPLDAAPPAGIEPPIADVPAPAPVDDGSMGGGGAVVTPEQATQFVQIMGQLGSPMRPGTNNTNVVERLLTILHAAVNQGASLVPGGGGQQSQPLDLSTEGATPDTNGMAAGMGMGGGPTFMSTRTKQVVKLDASGRALAEQAAAKENQSIANEWDRLAGTKGVSAAFKAICLREKAAAGTYFMSLNPDTGKVLNQRARQKLYLVKEILASSGTYKLLGMMSKSVAQSNPAKNAPRSKPSTAPANNNEVRGEIARLMNVDPKTVRLVTGGPSEA